MKSINAGTYWGIPVKIHWTFSLLFLFFLGYGWYNGATLSILFSISLFIILMFVCVILHEYGHALTAKRFGIKTLDIIISPIGGIARLEKLPEKPIQELKVAIAGPLVNLSIAFVFFILALIFFDGSSFSSPDESLESISTPQGFFALLIWINIVLFVFNLVPAFPMDGGRILRAILSMKYGKVTGTKYASVVGRILAVLFIGFGAFTQQYTLAFIGVFVFIMARSENEQMMIKSKLSGVLASELMNTEFSRLHLSTTMSEVFQKYIRGGEKNYLIFDSLGNISGVIPELFIKSAYKSQALDKTVNEYMSDNIYYAKEDINLDLLFEEMNLKGVAIAVIKNGDQIRGVIDRQMLFNFIQLEMSK